MGGPGSTRWGDRPPRPERWAFRWVSITDLTRRLRLRPGCVAQGKAFIPSFGWVDVLADCSDNLWSAITMTYTVTQLGPPALEALFPITATEPNYGGRRWWLLCPACGRRCEMVFAPWDFTGRRSDWCSVLWQCRICRRLAYPSQLQGRRERLQRKIERLVYTLRGFPPDPLRALKRPMGMRQRTFGRLEAELRSAMAEEQRCRPRRTRYGRRSSDKLF
jgi:hypothetical protein